jgi:DNA-damage-inducible protein J
VPDRAKQSFYRKAGKAEGEYMKVLMFLFLSRCHSLILLDMKNIIDVERIQMANLNIQVDDSLKMEVEELLDTIGISLSTAITLFLKQTVRYRGIPLELRAGPPVPESNRGEAISREELKYLAQTGTKRREEVYERIKARHIPDSVREIDAVKLIREDRGR